MIRALFWAVLLPATALILAIVSVAGAHSKHPAHWPVLVGLLVAVASISKAVRRLLRGRSRR